MKITKLVAILFLVGLFLPSSSIKADETDKKTIMTFSGPVQIENTQLAAGTYVFRLADTSGGSRNVVQILNQDETQVIATILAIPNYRMKPTGRTAVKFSESRNGSEMSGTLPDDGMPIKEWFYPGDNFGQEFKVAPRSVAEAQPVPVATADAAPTTDAAPIAQPAVPAAPAPEPQASAQQEPVAQPQTPQPAEPAATDRHATTPTQLPQTGGELPLLSLIGILALAGAASLRILSKVSA